MKKCYFHIKTEVGKTYNLTVKMLKVDEVFYALKKGENVLSND